MRQTFREGRIEKTVLDILLLGFLILSASGRGL